MKRAWLALLLMCLLPVAASAATCVVNAGGSIQAAVNTCTTPGDVISIHAGTYTENVTLPASGTSGNPITIQNFGYAGSRGSGEAVTLHTNLSQETWVGVFGITDVAYITIQGLTFDGSQYGWALGTWSSGPCNSHACAEPYATHDIKILNNTFSNWGNDGTGTTSGCGGAATSCGVNGPTVLQYAYNVLVDGNHFFNNYGVNIGIGPSYNSTYSNNLIDGVTHERLTSGNPRPVAAGFHEGGDDQGGPTAHNNLIKDNNISGIQSSDVDSYGIWCDINVHDSVYDGNIIHDSQTYALGILTEYRCTNITVQRNIIYNNFAGMRTSDMVVGPSDGSKFYNNVVFNNTQWGIAVNNAKNTTVKNNISMNNGSSQIFVSQYAVTNGVTLSNNLYFKNSLGTNIGLWNSTNDGEYNTANLNFSSWVSQSGETGAKNADPLFVNPSAGNFNLGAGSPAIDAGIGVGLPFNGSAPDMGGLESGASLPTVNFSATTPVPLNGSATLTYSASSNGGTGLVCTPSIASGQADATWTGTTSAQLIAGTGSPKTGAPRTVNAPTTYRMSCTDSNGPTTVDRVVVIAAPVLIYELNEGSGTTATDTSGNALNGSLVGTPLWVAGIEGTAVQFNGSSQYIQLADNALLDFTGDFTAALWVKSTQGAVLNVWPIIMNKAAGNTTGWEIVLHESNASAAWYAQVFVAGVGTPVYGVSNLADGNWHHIAVRRQGSTLTVFEGGAPVNNGTVNVSSLANAGGFVIGSGDQLNACCFYNGAVDRVRLVPYALSNSEIAALAAVSDTVAPAAPTGLTATPISSSQINLQWFIPTQNTDGTPLTDLAGYRITYCTGVGCTPNIDLPDQ
jgi:parallel beta-helix repeat protein